jgi:large subunit ribosomal protein L24
MTVRPHPTGKLKIRRGDTVQVTTGKDVGRTGKVMEVIPEEGRVIVEKLNIVHKHTRPAPVKGTRGAQMTPGGVVQTEAPLRVDNVALLCPSCSKPTRVGYRFTDEGAKVRICRRKDCGKDID